MVNSSVSIGSFESDTFDLDAPIVIRECPEDQDYPLSLDGVTLEGHDISISLSSHDVDRLYQYFS